MKVKKTGAVLRGRAIAGTYVVVLAWDFVEGHEAVIHVSLTDDPPLAQAFVVIEARPTK